jgi:hypothetical protein
VSGNLQGKESFAAAMIAIEESDASEWETVLPEPADGSGRGLDERFLVDGEGGGKRVDDGMMIFGCEMGR